MNFWPENPGFTVIKQHHVHVLQDVFQAVKGRGGIQGHRGLGPGFLDLVDEAVQVHRGFHVNPQPIGPGRHKGLDVALGIADHQVDIQGQAGGPAQGPGDRRADGDIGDEMPVHDVHVDPVDAGLLRFPNVLRQAAEIRR